MIKQRPIDIDNLYEGITHQPKGRMCMGCANRFKDCSHLDFTKMRVIGKYNDTSIVKCTEWVRTEIVGQVSC